MFSFLNKNKKPTAESIAESAIDSKPKTTPSFASAPKLDPKKKESAELTEILSLFKINEKSYEQLKTLISIYGEDNFKFAAQQKIFKVKHEISDLNSHSSPSHPANLGTFLLFNYLEYLSYDVKQRPMYNSRYSTGFNNIIKLLLDLDLLIFDRTETKAMIDRFYHHCGAYFGSSPEIIDVDSNFSASFNARDFKSTISIFNYIICKNPDLINNDHIKNAFPGNNLQGSTSSFKLFSGTLGLVDSLSIESFEKLLGYRDLPEKIVNLLIEKIKDPIDRASYARLFIKYPSLIEKLEPLYINNKINNSLPRPANVSTPKI